MKHLSLFLALALSLTPSPLLAQDIPLKVEGEGVRTVTVVDKLPFTIKAPPRDALHYWELPPGVTAKRTRGNVLTITAAPKGAVTINVEAVWFDQKAKKLIAELGEITVQVGDVPGPGPVPPGPVPPKPPDPPEPRPDPAPIPFQGFRVLIIYESGMNLSLTQHSIIYGKTVRDYLQAKCVVGADGKTKEFRIYDKDLDVTGDAYLWQTAMNRGRTKTLPWLIISNGKTGYEGPLPNSVAETMILLRKFGE